MASVAALASPAASRKRGIHDAFGQLPQCSPKRIAFLDLADSKRFVAPPAIHPSPMKRSLADLAGLSISNKGSKACRGTAHMSVSEARSTKRETHAGDSQSAFGGEESQSAGEEAEASFAGGDKGRLCRNCKQAPGVKLYTEEEVRSEVVKAVEETKRMLQDKYDQILREKLQDQFNSFNKFTHDQVSRQLNQSSYDYCS